MSTAGREPAASRPRPERSEERYLNREPVHARQGNWIYYTQRFARRNAVAVGAATMFILFLATFGIVMSIQRQHIAEERDRATAEGRRAERVSEFMLRVFTAADPFENNGEVLTASQLLDRAAGTIQGELNEQPEVRARLLEAIGRAYRRQSQPERAVTFLEESLRIRRQAGIPDDAQTGQFEIRGVDMVVAELAGNHPMILGVDGHLVVLVEVQYERAATGAVRVIGGTVIDPEDGQGVRRLRVSELRPNYIASVRIEPLHDFARIARQLQDL